MGQAFRPGLFAAIPAPESMAAWVMSYAPATDAEALKLLRARFPDCPLSLRVAALDYLMRRLDRLPSPGDALAVRRGPK